MYSLQYRGMKLGLHNTKVLLRMAGNPERSLRCIHVAGTNGKGSTSSFIASILQESGYRTGLYTSPHLIDFSERIRIDGRPIEEERIVSYIRKLKPAIEETKATFFEATTCLAFCYFADEEVDYAVIETGLGGRLDATNVITPRVSVISTISRDHTHILGNTLVSIGREKGGIIKRGVPCVTGVKDPDVLRTFDRIAARRETRVARSRRMLSIEEAGVDSFRLRGRGDGWRSGTVTPGLSGIHQRENARLAVAASLLLFRREGNTLRPSAVRRGLERVVRNAGLRGRREIHGRVTFDVAHNPEGAEALAASMDDRGRNAFIVVIGMMRDKDAADIIRPLGRIAAMFVSVAPGVDRALPEADLRKQIRELGFRVVKGGSVRAGLRRALHCGAANTAVLVTGSHYVVGAALEAIAGNRA